MSAALPTSARGMASSANDVYTAYGFTRPSSSPGNHYNSREFLANTTNEIAMALLNRDIEQGQWERNAEYDSPAATYQRLVNMGMNPVLAMQTISGIGSTTPNSLPVQGDYTSQNYGSARAANLGAAVNSAANIGTSALQFAQARNLDTSSNLMPQQVYTQQDMQRAQTWLTNQQASMVKALAEADISAKGMRQKLDQANAALQESLKRQADAQIQLMNKEFQYYDTDKAAYYGQINANVAKAFSDVKVNESQRQLYNSQSDLNRNLIAVGNQQIALLDKQGRLVDAQEFAQRASAVEQVIKNAHLSTGTDYNYLGAGMLIEFGSKGVFDEFGRIKNSSVLLDENSPSYQIWQKFQKIDAASYSDAHKLARQAVVSGYINSGCQVLNSGASMLNAATGSILPWQSSSTVTSVNGNSVSPLVVKGFGQ